MLSYFPYYYCLMLFSWNYRNKEIKMALLYIFAALLCMTNILALPTAKVGVTKEDYRLAQVFKITSYNLALTVPEKAFTKDSTEYTGTVSIVFSFTDDKTEYITLHAHSDFITIKKVTFNNIEIDSTDYSVDADTNILKIKLVNSIAANRAYTLIIEFTGTLSTEEMYGFYKSTYVDKKGKTKYLATTQFEPTHARKAFPCFDEPSFKAIFDVTITFPSSLNVLFNTKEKTSKTTNGLTTTTFETTPVMSTYLVAFIISEFTCTDGKAVDGVAFQVCSRDEVADTRKRAAEVGSKVIEQLNSYTGYSYSKSMKKMDQVAIPDFSAGAMENWGLVTYREAALLWDEEESSNRYNQRITTVIAHELTHQWFGDLVTCNWWSETFLNEGFATYFEYFIANEVVDGWELDKQFLIEEVHTALVADALTNSQALQSEASTPTEISDKFGTISYNKGGSILRMVANFLGADNFKAGLKKYLTDNAYSSAEPEDLWTALDGIAKITLPADTLADVMENWIQKPGFPLVTVSLKDNKITITQERFLLSDTDTKSKWYVPISYTTSEDKKKFASTDAAEWLTPKKDVTFDLPEKASWIIVNNLQTGYYRVNYDDALWEKIKTVLNSDSFEDIDELNRAQIIDDLFNLARSGKVKYNVALDIATYLSKDTSYYSWYAAFNGYDFLLRRVGVDDLGTAISSSLLEQLTELYKSVPISKVKSDDQIYTHKQVVALTWACKLGNEECVTETTKQFQEYKEKNTKPDKNLRSVVYCNGLRYSEDNADWEFLWKAYLNAADLPTEQVTILSALGCTTDKDLLIHYLTKTITDDSGIRSQDTSSAFSSVYSNNPEGIAVAYDFLTENYEKIAEKYQSMNSLGNLIKGIAERFTTEEEVKKLTEFIGTKGLPEAFKSAANEALETAKANLKWKEEYEAELNDFYDIDGNDSTTTIAPTDGPGGASSAAASFMVILVALFASKLSFF